MGEKSNAKQQETVAVAAAGATILSAPIRAHHMSRARANACVRASGDVNLAMREVRVAQRR